MKSFLKKILIFSTIVTAIFVAYEVALLWVPNEYSYKKGYLEEHKDSLRVLVLGNSHLADCIDPSLLGKWSFNAAQPGRSAHYDLQLMKEYIGQMTNLQCIVMPLSYDYQYWGHKYEAKHDAKFNTYRCMYLKYMGYPYSDGEWWHWSEILNSNYDHSGRLAGVLYKPLYDLTMCDSLGMEIDASYETRGDDWMTQQLPETKSLPDSTEQHLNYQDNVKIYSEMVSLARQHHKRLILLAMPIYKTARVRVSQQRLDEMNQFVDLLRGVNPDIEFYNFIDDKRFEQQDFYNSIHLNNSYGAKKFTPILRNIIGE